MLSKLVAASALLVALASGSPIRNTSEYEYVLVGSGPGGGPLAANLARAGHSVFLIEAGGDYGEDLSQLSPFRGRPEGPEQSWAFFVNHYQNDTQARRDHKFSYRLDNGSYYVGTDPPAGAEPVGILYPRGNSVGGSSQINALNVALPPANDWEYIADLTKDDTWRAAEMRQHFVDLERNAFFPPGTPGHGFDGYVGSNFGNISHVVDREGLAVILREGISLLEGIEVEDDAHLAELMQRDVNSPDTELYHTNGVGFFQMPLHMNGTNRRTGAYDHIRDTLDARDDNGNPAYPLTLSTHSLATKVLFEMHSGVPKAVGVEYLVGEAMYGADRRYDESNPGELRTVTATREVIVAGGAFNTPQILKLSGVGPKEELESLGIPVIKDLPAVGKYMQDNYEGGISVRAQVPWEGNPIEAAGCDPSLPEDPCMTQWLEDGSGPYGDGGAPAVFTFRSSVSENDDADIFAFGTVNSRFTGMYPGYSSDLAVLGDARGSSWSIVKMQTGNTAGTVELRSRNPREPPLINFNYFEEQGERDLKALMQGTEFVLEMLNAVGEPYTPLEVIEPVPGVGTRQSLMDQTFSHHVTSTCRMGPKDDPDYCVDSKFRVNGIEGLRVVDASVFPRTPGGFPVAPTFVIGQKAFRTIVSEL